MEKNETRYSFGVTGMTCASCVRIVEKQLAKAPGIRFVSVNLATEKAFVVGDEGLDFETLASQVKNAGYAAQRQAPRADQLEKKFAEARRRFILALALTFPLALGMILHMTGLWMVPGFVWMELIGAALVLFGPGFGTLRGAGIALAHGHTNMDTLVSLGALTSWLTVPLHLAIPEIFSFGTVGAMILAFHLTGRYIEARLKWKAGREIRALLSLQVSEALVETGDGRFEMVPVESVKAGARIRLRTGEKIPVDGKLVEGGLLVDESMITGESLPVTRSAGGDSALIGGTLVVQGGGLMIAEKVGEDSYLSQMIRLVEEAQSAKVPIQALADRITQFFTPAVLLTAALSGILWFFFYDSWRPFLAFAGGFIPWIVTDAGPAGTGIFVFTAVLVIACPCALGLAVPMALVAGSGLSAKRGLIIRSGEAIQRARDVDTLVFDKTGTLTQGRPKVVESGIPEDAWPALAALEAHSIHPLAHAVLEYARERGLGGSRETGSGAGKKAESLAAAAGSRPGSSAGDAAAGAAADGYDEAGNTGADGVDPVSNVVETAGVGLRGDYRGKKVSIGKPRNPERYRSWMDRGMTVVEWTEDEIVLGALGIQDPIKEGAREALDILRARGLRLIMATGDQEATAMTIARQLGIDEVRAGIKPQDKFDLVHGLQREGRVVAMVGDGINDAAALKTSDVGFAMGSGTSLSVESADIVLTTGDLVRISEALDISEITLKRIYRNLFWAFFYNIVAIPAAVLGLLHPVVAELAMTFSSINVILGSNRIPGAFFKRLKSQEQKTHQKSDLREGETV
jgi:Cu+-exporting ATPase